MYWLSWNNHKLLWNFSTHSSVLFKKILITCVYVQLIDALYLTPQLLIWYINWIFLTKFTLRWCEIWHEFLPNLLINSKRIYTRKLGLRTQDLNFFQSLIGSTKFNATLLIVLSGAIRRIPDLRNLEQSSSMSVWYCLCLIHELDLQLKGLRHLMTLWLVLWRVNPQPSKFYEAKAAGASSFTE